MVTALGVASFASSELFSSLAGLEATPSFSLGSMTA